MATLFTQNVFKRSEWFHAIQFFYMQEGAQPNTKSGFPFIGHAANKSCQTNSQHKAGFNKAIMKNMPKRDQGDQDK